MQCVMHGDANGHTDVCHMIYMSYNQIINVHAENENALVKHDNAPNLKTDNTLTKSQ